MKRALNPEPAFVYTISEVPGGYGLSVYKPLARPPGKARPMERLPDFSFRDNCRSGRPHDRALIAEMDGVR